MSVNTKRNSYYQRRNNIRLDKDDMTKDEIFPVTPDEGSGEPVPPDGFDFVVSSGVQVTSSGENVITAI